MTETPEEKPDSDWFLEAIVSAVNSEEVQFPITLNVGGILVSGYIIGGETYFDEFAAQVSSGLPPEFYETEAANLIKEQIESIGQTYSEYEKAPEDRTEDVLSRIAGFIHLGNARIYHTDGSVIPTRASGGFLWRGRLSAVDGFWLGQLELRAI